MKIIVCLDDDNGMMFNHRRQSRDRILCQNILDLCAGERLYMNSYSAELFEKLQKEKPADLVVCEDFLEQAAEGVYCFVENVDILPYQDEICGIILYRWNRRYPGDVFFPLQIQIENGDWKLQSSVTFSGSSHEEITREIYARMIVE